VHSHPSDGQTPALQRVVPRPSVQPELEASVLLHARRAAERAAPPASVAISAATKPTAASAQATERLAASSLSLDPTSLTDADAAAAPETTQGTTAATDLPAKHVHHPLRQRMCVRCLPRPAAQRPVP